MPCFSHGTTMEASRDETRRRVPAVVLLVEIVTRVQVLGRLISTAQRSFDPAIAYALLAMTGALGIAIHGIVAATPGWSLRYQTRAR